MKDLLEYTINKLIIYRFYFSEDVKVKDHRMLKELVGYFEEDFLVIVEMALRAGCGIDDILTIANDCLNEDISKYLAEKEKSNG